MIRLVLSTILLISTTSLAYAQFRIPTLDMNRLVDSVKNVGKASKEINQAA